MHKNADGSVTFTPDEIAGMIARGETRSDFTRVPEKPLTDRDMAGFAVENDDLAVPDGWEKAVRTSFPAPRLTQENKRQVTLRLDPVIIEHFKASGRGWQSRINDVLGSFVRGSGQGR